MCIQQTLSERVRHFRKIHNLTQSELAADLHVEPFHISKVERGVSRLSLDVMVRFCQRFDISMADLLPVVEQDEAKAKRKCIEEISKMLELMEYTQVKLIKTLIASKAE
jgi:transcriptional regulator with XRE-family HTH domain